MNTKVKKGLKITGIVIGTILVIMLVLPFAFKGKILEIVKKEANNMLNAKLEFADLNLSFFSHFPKASIELQQLSLTGIGDFEKDTLVSAKEIDIAVNIMSLFGDKGIEINHIILEKPQVKAVKLANGNVNWDIMKPDTTTTVATDTTSSSSSFALKLKKFTIEDGRIAYIDDASKMEFYTQKLNLKLSGDMSTESTSIDCHMTTQNIDFISGAVPYLKNAEFEMDMKVLADLVNNKFTFDDAAAVISQDKDTRNNHGIMVNINEHSGITTSKFQMQDLPQDVAKVVDKMNVGEISKAFTMINEKDGKEVCAIVKLKAKINGHKATIAEDYQDLKEIVMEKRREEMLQKWILDKQKHTYVRINENWQKCDFKYPGWVKND